ncbi:MAG: twin-arginine translocase TatA/TatE family subunit [Opitutaceae bacterium]|nr:twin-arginine translocase TatA/TatE family subunit [Opitutaceae bacterium]
MGHIAAMDLVPASLAFIDGLGGSEMVLIFIIVLMLFGGQKLPEFARGLGKTIREFKKAAAGVEEEFKRALDEDERKKLVAAPAVAADSAAKTSETGTSEHDYSGDYPDSYADGSSDSVPADPVTDSSEAHAAAAAASVSGTATVPASTSEETLADTEPDKRAEADPENPAAVNVAASEPAEPAGETPDDGGPIVHVADNAGDSEPTKPRSPAGEPPPAGTPPAAPA